MRETMLMFAVFGALILIGGSAQAAGPHPIAQPWSGVQDFGVPSYPVERDNTRVQTDHLTLAADHILDQQCQNGGFGWPHADCSATFHNITGPIILGTLGSYAFNQNALELTGALNGGVFELAYRYDNGEARFSTFTPAFLDELAQVANNTTFSDHVAVGFFDELVAGSYGPDDLDTAAWITSVEDHRTGAWVNLRPWEFHTIIPVAARLGQVGQDALFEQAILDGLDTLDNSNPATVYSDIIGLAGAVRGLGYAGRMSFPAVSALLHSGVDGIDNLEDLAAYLASLQNPNGSWYWHSDLASPTADDEDVQTTAYAVLALIAIDRMTAADYRPAIEAGRDWMVALQLPDGGFPVAPGGTENTEVEGEALTAIAASYGMIFIDGFETGNVNRWDGVAP